LRTASYAVSYICLGQQSKQWWSPSGEAGAVCVAVACNRCQIEIPLKCFRVQQSE
jgi:hypothetical protein